MKRDEPTICERIVFNMNERCWFMPYANCYERVTVVKKEYNAYIACHLYTFMTDDCKPWKKFSDALAYSDEEMHSKRGAVLANMISI